MTTVGYSTLDVIPSVKNLRSQLERQTAGDFAAAGRKGGQQFGDAAAKTAGSRFQSRVTPFFKNAVAPIAGFVAGAAIVDLFKDAVSGASDLAESGNKINVIFGDAATQVDAFAKRGARAFGQTQLDVLNAAGAFGTFGKAAGLTGSALASFSTDLVGLSTDLASFFNTSPEQAVEAIGAALRGEAEPIRAYGVLLDDATLRQEALRQGLIQTTKQALTPQQKVLAAYQVILKQTADAQGDFGRTSGGLANQQRILAAQWSEMRTELGAKLLPAVTATVRTFNDGVIPAMEGAGGVVADGARAFGDLPTPVKAATAALVAFKIAQSTGATGLLGSGLSSATSSLDSLRLRAMLAADQYRTLRQGQLEIVNGSGRFTAGVGRMSASLGALRTAGIGAGAGLRRGLSGAVGLVGGPWGAAFIAGTAIVAHFWSEHQKAKQRVEDFTATLDKETGALTASSREFAAKKLLDEGILKNAQSLGISLSLVTDAALGQKTAMSDLNEQLNAVIAANGNMTKSGAGLAAVQISNAVNDSNGVVQQGIANQKLFASALDGAASAAGGVASAQGRTTSAVSGYATMLDKARAAVQKLLDKENERRNRNLGAFQDQTRLAQALHDARKEAADGAKTLDANSEAGRKNRDSLAGLADAWNSAADKVKNAKGAYADMRQNFIDVAEKMGATEAQAKRLADRLLGIPKDKAITITTPGMDQALADLREAHRLIKFGTVRLNIESQAAKNQQGPRLASGGLLRGPGSGTSDSILMWGSNGEFMQRKAAVDHYGVDFMRRLNALQVPKYAGGGLVGGVTTSGSTTLGGEIHGVLSIDRDGRAFLSGVARAEVDAASRSRAHAGRLSSLDGVRR